MRLLVTLLAACTLDAAVKLPALISDHMVLQQGMPVRIWGSADPSESVRIDFQGQSVSVQSAPNGNHVPQWVAMVVPIPE